jgi:N-acyl-phosphatidylethanolamine-hydrolysing phospholipase D
MGIACGRAGLCSYNTSIQRKACINKDLKAMASLGIHWGTFELTDESLDESSQQLAKARAAKEVKEKEFFVLKIGEARVLPKRS